MTRQGGKRSGSGRKPKPDKKITIAVSLSPALVTRLRDGGNVSKQIEALLIQHLP